MEGLVQAEPALAVEVEVAAVIDLTGQEVLSEFAKVMHEWNFAPFRRGEVALPTLGEARRVFARSRYCRC